ncbi:MAG: ribosome-associated translation inhibitor RaiA [Saprospiraceae bacterium]|jgi:putative sigma-54 modulation protein|uniref:ribosome hibernation-promoting factor, HPF/YfiA family n=1 Tax=Candidatus Brachybacter algidus TaxID=2982024 RepID=UPI001B537224|nr:ribosome-associated translation inhibitor RaiA [Candidatus Brachybacter algidus]MBP7307180.1 ribosome-associated translation inhibitor RaiA [Saprospiraceae bacterium]MBK6373078.1 ribosome-associated translation inhibitor RaiA [Candidatus Brachybacter algidus]MBK6447730.1 ribosome-associated translation inhibitor RaiA [Candidatus Brachybacter algidus]MBK7602536.1 ribosome-associated translation inhibitor RaiA [Candidatus Brachybacter algidus]MBK8354796.1 ribosome-associated translation inhib
MKITIEADQFKADVSLTEFIEKKVIKLDHYYDKIIDAHVILKLENAGQVKDKVAELILNIPGDTIVSKETNKTFESAIDEGVDNIKRQLIKRKEKMRETN